MENKCPRCQSTNIRNDSVRNDNGIVGPGYKSWVVEEKYSCNDCGVYFRPVAEKDLNLAVMGHGNPERAVTGPRWVKCSDRLPGYKTRVKWRDGNDHSFATKGKISLFEMDKANLEEWEWLDEQPAAVSQDAHEKEIMMQAFDKVRQIFEGRQWVMDGRGSYPYNDDRYQQEVRYMYDEFDQVVKDTWANIKSKSIEYREWIISEYLQKDHPAIPDILNRLGYQRIDEQPAAGREEDAVAFHDWVLENEWEINYREQRTHTTAELYELFKQQKEK